MRETIDRLWWRIFYFGAAMWAVGFGFLFAAVKPENAHGWQVWVAAITLGMGVGSWMALYTMPRLLPYIIGYFLLRRELRRRPNAE